MSEETTAGGIIIPDFAAPPADRNTRISEAIERAAKAVALKIWERRPGGTMLPWHCSAERTEAMDYVRATLESLREPTDAISEALCQLLCAIAYQAEFDGIFMAGFKSAEEAAGQIWRKALDAALNSPE